MLRATLAVIAGLLVAAAPAGAGTRTICAFPDVCKTAAHIEGLTP
jgi:hypothetical protein